MTSPEGIAIVRTTIDGRDPRGRAARAAARLRRRHGARRRRPRQLEYAVVPIVVEGQVTELVYAVQPAPGRGFFARVAATFTFLADFWWQFLVAGALAAGIALVMARWLARGMTQPLRDMAQAAPTDGDGRLLRSASHTNAPRRGRAARGRLQPHERGARAARASRRDLVANVSHELKTPIAAIRAHLENLLDGVEQPNPETLQVMLAQSERLGRLVEQLLDLSQAGIGRGAARSARRSRWRRSSRRWSPRSRSPASDRGVDGRAASCPTICPRSTPTASASTRSCSTCVDNAVRFTPDGRRGRDRGRIGTTVRSRSASPTRAWASRPSTCPGCSSASTGSTRRGRARTAGTGIGLAIARSVVEAHGGHIWAESEPGKGSVFTFDLPVAPGGHDEQEGASREVHHHHDHRDRRAERYDVPRPHRRPAAGDQGLRASPTARRSPSARTRPAPC